MTHHRLPPERKGINRRCMVSGVRFHIITGEYEDGTLGEVEVRAGKPGTELRLLHTVFMFMSMGLQRGIPLQLYIDNVRGQQIGEGGVTDDQDIPLVKNILDYVVRFLEMKYGDGKGSDE